MKTSLGAHTEYYQNLVYDYLLNW